MFLVKYFVLGTRVFETPDRDHIMTGNFIAEENDDLSYPASSVLTCDLVIA